MNKPLVSMIAMLLIFPLGAVSAQAVGDDIAEPQSAPTSAEPVPAATTPTETVSVADKAPEPINGAFGIPLGKRFEPSMVAKVLGEQEQSYKGQGGTKLKGKLLRIEPSKPDERFQQYSIKTTDAGIIYAIQGDYQYEVNPDETKKEGTKPEGKGKGAGKPGNKKQANTIQKTCKAAVKTMAGELESRYGKPRGQGWDGLWYTFRQFSDTSNRGLKLYGHRCRSGMYSVFYIDEKVQWGTLPSKASTLATGSVPAKPEPGSESGSQTDAQPTANP